MSYIELDLESISESRQKIENVLDKQDVTVKEIVDRLKISMAYPRKSRNLYAVDSGFSSAYEIPFLVLKTAIIDENIHVDYFNHIYFFHVDNYQSDRLKRLLTQQSLYEALLTKIKNEQLGKSLILVDGTITLKIFYPTAKDNREYKGHFKDFYERTYSPLLEQCLRKDIIPLGFLKRTGSTYLADHLEMKGIYDIYIMQLYLKENGCFFDPPVDIPGYDEASSLQVTDSFITFYLNLKGWTYRFELMKQQQNHYLECIENLLFWSTNAHYGMNPVFSKADEYARVTKREAELKFNYFIQGLSAHNQRKLRLGSMKKTHFGYRSKKKPIDIIQEKEG